MKAVRLTTVLLSLSPLAAAWPWPQWLPEIDALIVRRADNPASTSEASATETASATATTAATDDSKTTGKATPVTSNLNTGGITKTATDGTSETGTDTASGTGKGKTGSGSGGGNSTRTTFNAQDPAGSITITDPVTTASTALYKIGDFVTFGWNYTGLQATPTALDVLVSCRTASETWTLTQNMSFESPGHFTWDTGKTAQTSPLLVQEYTLIIYDAESSVSATASAGYLAAFSGFTFGLYTGQAYTPLESGWVCATCSAALSADQARALGFVLAMAGITVLSFTWFVTGLW